MTETLNRHYPLPEPDNFISEDVHLLRQALSMLDLDIHGLFEELLGKANSSHQHAIGDVNNLEQTLSGKAPIDHSHRLGDLANVEATVNGAPTGSVMVKGMDGWNAGNPATVLGPHEHDMAQVRGLLSALAGKATPADVQAAIDAFVGAAPTQLDTLVELAAALGNDANFANTITAALASKLPKAGGQMSGKLSGQNFAGKASEAWHALEVVSTGVGGDNDVAGMSFHVPGNFIRGLHLRGDGYFGLTGWQWYVDPSGNMTASGNVAGYSDRRLKQNITPIESALDKVMLLEGVRFEWNGRSTLVSKPKGTRDIGVIAQQVAAVFPEVVVNSIPDPANDGIEWLTVDYARLVPVLIQAIKELRQKVDHLEARG